MSSTGKTRRSPSSSPATQPPPTPETTPDSPPPAPTLIEQSIAAPTEATPKASRLKAPEPTDPKSPFLTNLRRHLTAGESARVERVISILSSMDPDNMARAAAPLLNDFGIQQAMSWSSCANAREFGMVIRGHAFTVRDSKLTLNTRFHRIIVALVQHGPPHRTPEVTASLLLKVVAASLFMHCCETAVRI